MLSTEHLQVIRLICYFTTAIAGAATAGVLLTTGDSLGRGFGLALLAMTVNSLVFGIGTVGKVFAGNPQGFFLEGLATINTIFMAFASLLVLWLIWRVRRR